MVFDVEPNPTVVAAPTSNVKLTPLPVSVVEPIPLLETPVIGKRKLVIQQNSWFSITCPGLLIVNLRAPPVPVLIPTFTVNVLVVTDVIAKLFARCRITPAELGYTSRGYEWSVGNYLCTSEYK